MPPGPVRVPLRIRRPEGASDDGAAHGGIRRSPAARARSLALAAVLTVAGLGLGWNLLGGAVADALAGTDPQAALLWRPDHAGALSALAEQRLDGGDARGAAALARRSLMSDPLDVRAIRVMGLAAERLGDQGLADRLMKQAGARSHRDGATQIWLFSRTAAQGDFAEAFARADALLRDRPELARRFYPVMSEMAGRPEARDALTARLKINPPWRESFMQTYIRQAADPGQPYALLERMEAGGVKPTPIERNAMLDRLVRSGRYEQAFVFWVQALPESELTELADIRNGEFLRKTEDGPFTWTIEGRGKNFVEFVDAPDREGGTLNIVLPGGPAPSGFVRQLLVLPPGRHVLSGEVRADGFSAAAGPVWSIRCADQGSLLLGETQPLLASTPWRRFEVAFEVPQTGCQAQWLRLRPGGKDRRMSGEIWYDKLAIRR